MIKKELFFHRDLTGYRYARSLGFSARFTPAPTATDDAGHPVVTMAITQCNKKDKVFSKKIARKYLREREGQVVRVKDVPNLLSAADLRAQLGGFAEISDGAVRREAFRYDFLMKKFI